MRHTQLHQDRRLMPVQSALIEHGGPRDLAQRPAWSDLLSHPLRTFHTVRHLQPRQLVYQALRRVQPIAGAPVLDGEAALIQRRTATQAEPAANAFDGDGFFCFLNRRIQWQGADRWYPAGADDLWIFNLHYFRFLATTREDHAQVLILDWIANNRDPREPAWHPYPISLRVREWTEWLHAHPDAPVALRRSMATRERAAKSDTDATPGSRGWHL